MTPLVPGKQSVRPGYLEVVLIALVVALNMGAIVIRERLRRKYATGAF